MGFMRGFIYQKGQTYSADCAHCGATHVIHEWTTDAFNEERDAMQEGRMRCNECCSGSIDPDTFQDNGKQYAGRYSAPGYMDCTDWNYDTNKRRLERTLRELYGD